MAGFSLLLPQREVRAVFPKETDAFGSMKKLIQEGLEEDAIIEGKRDSSLSKIVDEIQKTLPKTEAEISDALKYSDRGYDFTKSFAEQIDDYLSTTEQFNDPFEGKAFVFDDSDASGESSLASSVP